VPLNPLQERIALAAAILAEREGFALVGGAALIVLDVIERRTEGLDFFRVSCTDYRSLICSLLVREL
jgi:hypothetical protein